MATTAQLARQFTWGEAVGLGDSLGFGNLKFPTTDYETESGGMWFVLNEYKYSKPTLDSNFQPISTGNSIALPMPFNLNSSYQANWGTENLGAWGSFLSNPSNQNEVMKFVNEFKDSTSSLTNFKSFIENKASGFTGGFTKDFLKAIGTDIMTSNPIFQNIGIAQGIARNPFTAVLFESMNLRDFSFHYRLTPRSLTEANTIRSIIKMLKFGMHPSYTSDSLGVSLSNGLFKYPYMYLPAFTKNEYLFDFGFCAVTGLSVDYHSENGSIYIQSDDNKIPAFITLSIQLKEMEVNTKEVMTSYTEVDNSSKVGR